MALWPRLTDATIISRKLLLGGFIVNTMLSIKNIVDLHHHHRGGRVVLKSKRVFFLVFFFFLTLKNGNKFSETVLYEVPPPLIQFRRLYIPMVYKSYTRINKIYTRLCGVQGVRGGRGT